MEAIRKLLDEIRAVDPDEIRQRLVEIETEAKELRRVLRLASHVPTAEAAK